MAEGYAVRSALQAAKDLKNYLAQKNAPLGNKAAPIPFIAAAQTDMGGGLAADGIMGPKTRTRMNDLISGKVVVPNIAAAAMVAPPAPAEITRPTPSYTSVVMTPKASVPTVGSAPPVDVVVATPVPTLQPTMPPDTYKPEVIEAVAAIPQQDRSEMVAALDKFSAQPSATMADYDALLARLSAQFTPAIKQIADEVNMQALQRQATTEHNALMREDDRWTKNNDVLQLILNKFAQLQTVLLANDAVSKRVYEVYGVHL